MSFFDSARGVPDAWVAGRSRLFARLNESLQRCRNTPAPVLIRCTGSPGMGKTTILNALVRALREDPHIAVLRCACTPDTAAMPLSTLWAMLQSDAALPVRFPKHASGLEDLFATSSASLGRESLERGFVRLVEALAQDVFVVLAVDDAQWIDSQSALALSNVFARLADRALAAVFMQREEARYVWPAGAVEEYHLEPLPESACESLVRAWYSAAPEPLIECIAACSGGVPLIIEALARHAAATGATDPAALYDGLRSALEPRMRQLPRKSAELLLVCTLLREPIPYSLLRRMWNDDEFIDALEPLLDVCLQQRKDGLVFSHALVREAVQSIRSAPFPLQRRVFEALQSLENPSFEQLCDRFELARATGDVREQTDSAIRLAQRACEHQWFETAAGAYAQAAANLSGDPAAGMEVFVQYAELLRLLERDEEARALLHPIADKVAPLRGSGRLLGILANVLWTLELRDEAIGVCTRYANLVRHDEDREELHSVRLSLLTFGAQELSAADESARERLLQSNSPAIVRRISGAMCTAAAACGDEQTAERERSRIAVYERYDSVLPWRYSDDLSLLCALHRQGAQACNDLLTHFGETLGDRTSSRLCWRGVAAFARGTWAQALDDAVEIQASAHGSSEYRRALAPYAAMLALSRLEHPLRDVIARESRAALLSPMRGSDAELVAWHALDARTPGALPAGAVAAVIAWLAKPRAVDVIFGLPLLTALLAQLYDSPELRERSREPVPSRVSHWLRANHLLRLGYATRERSALRRAAGMLRELGAAFLAAFSAANAHGETDEDDALLGSLQIRSDFLGARVALKEPRHPLTARELEIATLVAHGMTNRDIAVRLFISERTVESHVSNALQKLSLASRTELVRAILLG